MARTTLPTIAPLDLRDAVVLVTGAAGGIGRAVARELHGRGARLVLVDLDAAVAAAVDTWGRLDVTFASAGISGGDTSETVASVADGVFEKVIAVNLEGVWNTIRATLPAVLDAQGHVLITSSTYAYVNGMVNAPYAATKAAVEQIGRALRVEVRRHGASAGVLHPGWVQTPIADVAFGKDPLATALVHRAFPAPLRRPIAPARVGTAVADGIETRRARIQVPRRWIPVAALRGIVNPISDAVLRSDRRLVDLVGEVEGRTSC